MDNSNFVQVEKYKHFGWMNLMPENAIRITPTSIGISANLFNRFAAASQTTATGTRVHLSILIDEVNNRIKLVPGDATNAFAFHSNSGTSSLNVRRSKAMRDWKLPVGDYVLEDERELVFKLAV